MSYTKQQLVDVRAKVQAALDAAFGPNVATVVKSLYGYKLSITVEFTLGGVEERAGKEREDWNRYCALFGLMPEHYGQTVIFGDNPWQLVGFAPRRSKYPIVARQISTGKELLLTKETVERQLGLVKLVPITERQAQDAP